MWPFRKLPYLELVNDPVCLRTPHQSDYGAWASLRRQSKAHLCRWEPDFGEDELSRDYYKSALERYYKSQRMDHAFIFFAYHHATGALLGGVSLLNIVRGGSQSATLGYWMGEPYLRKGYAFSATSAALDFAFSVLTLHRIEAACRPGNIASAGLLRKLGFSHEGHMREYLEINGTRRDYDRYAVLSRDWAAAPHI